MRPIYGCPENFRESLVSTHMATFREILMGACSGRSYECAYKLKFVALSVPRTIGVSKNSGNFWIRPRSLFQNFLMRFCSDIPSECSGQI